MNTANVLTTQTTELTRRGWRIVPDTVIPNHYMPETATGSVVCTPDFPGNCNAPVLNLIASAPVPIAAGMQGIAGMYRDTITSHKAGKTIIFTIVNTILSRINAQP